MAGSKRRQLAVRDWPAADQRAWITANAPGGLGAHWTERMRSSVRVSYVWWLLYLESAGSLDREAEPLDRVAPDRIGGFVLMLQRDHSPSTVHHHVSHLAQAMRVMAPGPQLAWLKAEVCRLQAIAQPPRADCARHDPNRHCLPLAEWPLPDQRAWSAAIGSGGLAAHWSEGTRNGVVQGCGRFLGYLERTGRLDREAEPAARLSRELIEDYIGLLQGSCAPATVHGYLKKLAEVLRVMAPEADHGWFNERVGSLAPGRPGPRRMLPRDDPSRRCMPLEAWPLPDRQAWAGALSPVSLLLDGGGGFPWREGTRKRVIQSYGRFLTYLDVTGQLDPSAEPAERLGPDLVKDYVRKLQRDCAPVTVFGYTNNLAQALRVMAPEANLEWLKRLVRHSRRAPRRRATSAPGSYPPRRCSNSGSR